MSLVIERPIINTRPAEILSRVGETFVAPKAHASSWRVREAPRRKSLKDFEPSPERDLAEIHLKAVSAMATHLSFFRHDGTDWFTASTHRGKLSPDEAPKPETRDRWLELAIKCDDWEPTGNLHDDPRVWDISRSQLTLKEMTSNGEVRDVYVVKSNSDFYRPFLKDGQGKHVSPFSDEYELVVLDARELIDLHINSFVAKQSDKPL